MAGARPQPVKFHLAGELPLGNGEDHGAPSEAASIV